MVQIEKRKKKGRPSKADLQARRSTVAGDASSTAEQQRRSSRRRRSFRYNIIDYDEDYVDEDDENDDVFQEHRQHRQDDDVEVGDDDVEDDDDDDDDEVRKKRRREKKVKLVLKLSSGGGSSSGGGERSRRGASRDSVTRPGRRGRVAASRDSEEEDEEEERDREVKKRRINGRALENDDGDDDDEDEGGEEEEGDDVRNGEDDVDEERNGKEGRATDDYNAPGTPGEENQDGEDEDVGDGGPTPMPDKKLLELILDKLQKKDTYGVYSEPVDPEELPDYHEVIEHPMDFSTVRKKLADGRYSTLEEFESDVFLISSNAMQYNASDTIYYKQAHAIKELAEKKFKRVRVKMARLRHNTPKSEPKPEVKSEQKETPCSTIKKQVKKQLWRGMQEPIGSDFSSGATLATEDIHDSCRADLASNHERSSNHDGPIEGVSALADHGIEKTHSIERADDPQSGKGALPKFGKKLFVSDENRRATYNLSNLHMDRPESIFTTFESDKKQLIPVGLSGEYAYARSLARFAANLGPIAWKIASKKIEQLLPPDFKYGRGWVGEFEPLPTAILFVAEPKDPFATRSQNREGQAAISSQRFNQSTFNESFAKSSSFGGAKPPITNVSSPQHHISLQNASGIPSNMMPKKVESNCIPSNEHKASAFPHQPIRVPRDTPCSEIASMRRAEPNSQPIPDHKKDVIPQRQLPQAIEVGGRSAKPCSPSVSNQKFENILQRQPSGTDIPASRPVLSAPINKNIPQSLPFRQQDGNGPTGAGAFSPNGHALEAFSNGKMVNDFVESNRAGASFPQRHDQSLSDPVLVMKMLTEKAQKQQNGSQPRPSVPSPRGGEGGNAAAAAASAWMSVGSVGLRAPPQNPFSNRGQTPTDSLYNGTRVFYPQAMQSCANGPASEAMRFHPEKNGLPFPAFVPRPIKELNENPVQNRTMIGFPQLAPHDLSRFQVQNAWRGLSPHTEQKPKQKQDTLPPDLNVAFQSSVDSQQPDLALQL